MSASDTDRTASATFIDLARRRLCVHLPGQVRACLDALDEPQVWWRPNESSHAIGNLVLHLIGSTRFYIGHVIGGSDFVRDRDSEFTERRELATMELRLRLDHAVAEADDVLATLDPATLVETADRAPRPATKMEVIGLQLAHFAAHTGQIAYASKLIKADAIHDIWRKTPDR